MKNILKIANFPMEFLLPVDSANRYMFLNTYKNVNRKCYLPVDDTMRLVDYHSNYTVLQVSNSDVMPL